MKVFISWSGETSKAAAEALRDWLPSVIQAIDPWMSAPDIEKGARWFPEISDQLQKSNFGIICLTPENLNAPWVLFEAGALSKVIEKSRVCPFLFGLEPTDIQGPLVQFQYTTNKKDDIQKLVETINKVLEKPILDKNVRQIFEKMWPDLEKILSQITQNTVKIPERAEKEILLEILELLRGMQRRDEANRRYNSFIESMAGRKYSQLSIVDAIASTLSEKDLLGKKQE